MAIPGGATFWARQTIESDIFLKKPAEWFKIWFFIVNKVNHKDTKQFKRGEGYFNWSRDKAELCVVSANQWHSCVSWLKWAKQITTQKTTRGNIIFVVNYDKFQTLKNYKTDTKTDTETEAEPKQNRSTTDTIYKNDKNDKNDKKIEETSSPSQTMKDFILLKEKRNLVLEELFGTITEVIKGEAEKFITYWTEPTKSGKKQRWELQPTFDVKRRLKTWLNNFDKFNKFDEDRPACHKIS